MERTRTEPPGQRVASGSGKIADPTTLRASRAAVSDARPRFAAGAAAVAAAAGCGERTMRPCPRCLRARRRRAAADQNDTSHIGTSREAKPGAGGGHEVGGAAWQCCVAKPQAAAQRQRIARRAASESRSTREVRTDASRRGRTSSSSRRSLPRSRARPWRRAARRPRAHVGRGGAPRGRHGGTTEHAACCERVGRSGRTCGVSRRPSRAGSSPRSSSARSTLSRIDARALSAMAPRPLGTE